MKDISVDYKLNLWTVFIRPLLLPLINLSPFCTKTERKEIQAKIRISLKSFLKLPKHFKTSILNEIFPINIEKRMDIELNNNKVKWEARINRTAVVKKKLQKYHLSKERFLPIAFNSILKKFTAWCELCSKPFYPEHLEYHGVKRIKISEIFTDLRRIRLSLKTKKKENIMETFSTHLKNLEGKIDEVLKTCAKNFKW